MSEGHIADISDLSPWTDEMLYKKYGLTPEEIARLQQQLEAANRRIAELEAKLRERG